MLSVPTVLAATVSAVEGEHSAPAIHPYVVGAVTLVLLIVLLLAVVSFGGGREHT